jgi:hypothetical protein
LDYYNLVEKKSDGDSRFDRLTVIGFDPFFLSRELVERSKDLPISTATPKEV